ncbi:MULTISPECIES: tape measure protein [unclassified Massilia]|uniref:tape measure protein n=1 Tax=unclassified Massilia TaxID=2609279 RepID=UPI0017860697|nr:MULTISPECIES: tape measure protein [unclassified Massilia]MBD8531492.1 tape measure protein [Massilia sp. CFBP 13647]MBD8673712.1 tape measure protein [Massilia sp. CFBP 13721]
MGYSATPGAIIRIGVDGAADSRREIDTVARTMSNLSSTVQNAMRNLAASIGIGAGVAGIVQMADEYAKYTAQLRLATQSQREYAAANADVKRIANDAQQGLASTGVLYARIANGTRELGTTQKQVAAITEVVNMSLKVSGATASEAASAQLQLSQAFASGTLRGEEFNAVNEAAPRLMLALADGIGVPVGALKKMAENGEITSKIMADVLPKALETLREEAKQIQTIGGAFTVLKNNAMEFIGVEASASGAVATLTGAIALLANNLALIAGAVATVTTAKLATWLGNMVTSTYGAVTANRALAASTLASAVATTEAASVSAAAKLAEAQANVRATASEMTLANARVAELRASVLAAQGATALAIATNGLIPAQARAIALAEANAVALSAQAVAANAATVAANAHTVAVGAQTAAATIGARAMGILRGAVAFLGGPIGAIVTLLGIGAMAWQVWGDKGSEAEKKVTSTLAEEIDDYLANLQKQIDKLKERNELAAKGMTTAALPATDGEKKREQILAEINRISKQTDLDVVTKTELLRVWGGRLNAVTQEMENFAAVQQKNKDLAFASKEAEWLGKNGTAAQKIKYELEELRKEYGRVTPEMEKFVRAKHADKGAAATVKQEASAYATLMTSIREKIAANQLEAASYSRMTDAQKMTIQLDAAIGTGKNKLSKEHIEAARAQIAVVAAQDAALVSAANVKKAVQELNDDRSSAYAAVMGEVTANEELVATYGMTKLQIEQLTLARLEDRLAQRAALELDAEEVAQLERMIAAKRRNMTAVGKLDVLERGSDVTKAKELLDIMTSIDEVTRSAAAGMAESFGRVGAAIGDMTTTLSGYGRAQAAIAAQLAAEKKDAKNDPVKIKAAETRASQAAATAQIRQYGDMAKAAKGFFKENTAGYKVMEGAEKAFRAYEMAMSIKSMVEKSGLLTAFTGLFVASKATQTAAEGTATVASTAMAGTQASAWGVTAVVKAIASMPFPLNIAAGAATLAAVVAIGAKMMGGLGGGAPSLSEQRQATQGTGSVLGASTTKSESIARSLELSLANSNIELNYTADMLRSLRSIESSLSGLGGVLIRAGVDGIVPATTGIGGGWLGKVGNSIFGGKTEALDTGVMSNRTTVAGVLAGGLNAQKYTDMKKDGGWFHSDKRWTDTQSLGAATNQQFSAAIADMVESVKEAGSLLGIQGDAFNQRLSSFVVDFGKISFKGMSGDDIQAALEGVFSKIADDMAQWSVQGLTQFQKVGEGHLETLVRISANYANLDASLQAINMTFGATGMSSIAAREGLISLVGGMDELSSKTASFGQNFLTEQERLAPLQKYVTEQLAKMGLGYIDTREEFKNHVLGLKLVTAAEQQQFAQLMDLESAFAKVTAQAKDLSRSAQDIADERAELQAQWDELTMTSAQLHAKARLAIDPSNRALFDQIALQRDLKASTQAASEALSSTVERLGATKTSALAYRDSLMLGNLSTLTPMEKYLETQRQYIEALRKAEADPSDSTAASNAQSTATAFLTASQVINASSAAFIGDKSTVMGDMGRLAAIAGQQLTDAQRQLSALDKQVVGIAQLNDTAAAIQEAILNQAAGAPMVAPMFDVQRYAASSSEAAGVLAAELKAQREANEKMQRTLDYLLEEAKGRRRDAERQKDEMVVATGEAGEAFETSVETALEEVAHIVANPSRVAPR